MWQYFPTYVDDMQLVKRELSNMEVSFVADREKDNFFWDMWKGSITHQAGHISTDSK